MNDAVLIYTQASETVGHGHAMRAIALANAATEQGLEVDFVLGDEDTVNILRSYGVNEFVDSQSLSNPSFVIRDLPDKNNPVEVKQEKSNGAIVLLMDDKGPARTEASIVCDAMMTPAKAIDLPQSSQTIYLYGLEYAVLRPEFSSGRRINFTDSQDDQRIVVALGGGFNSTVPRQVLEALHDGGFKGKIDVLLTHAGEDVSQLQKIADCVNAKIYLQSSSVQSFLSQSDLVITKLGVSLLEAFSTGAPCVLIEPTKLHLAVQNDLAEYYKDWPAIECGIAGDEAIQSLANNVISLLSQPEQLRNMSGCASLLVDGKGAQRLIKKMIEQRR